MTCFLHFVRYMLSSASVADPPIADILETTTLEPSTVDAADVQNRSVNASDVEVQRELRTIWKEGRLLVMSNDLFEVILGEPSFGQRLDSFTRRMKQYIERTDEEMLKELRLWLQEQWGIDDTGTSTFDDIIYSPSRSVTGSLEALRAVMKWFKASYPYYYDRCLRQDCGNTEDNTFIGYLAPNGDEKKHNSSRVELIHCSTCERVSRFPRYNDAIKVLFESRRGRCGEYSVAALALAESLGYSSRWVVDWADHVWIEV